MSSTYSSMMPKLEDYFCPRTIDEAISLLADYGKEAQIIAGGTDLLNLLRTRASMPKYIIDITRIPELDYITYDDRDGLRIGALAKINAVKRSEVVKAKYPLLYEATSQMGTTQVRNMATVVGNLCRAAPSADTAVPLLALDAKVRITASTETRIIGLEDFFTGPGKTILGHSDILTEIQMPRLPAGTGTAFLKATRVAIDLAKVNVATILTVKNDICEDVGIALGAVAPTPIRAKKAEEVLKGKRLDDKKIEEAAEMAAGETKPITDLRSTANYRKDVSKILVSRALKMALERAGGKMGG